MKSWEMLTHKKTIMPPHIKWEKWNDIKSKILNDYNFCSCCTSTNMLEIDHILPVSEGGLPLLENLQVLCKKCNLYKRF